MLCWQFTVSSLILVLEYNERCYRSFTMTKSDSVNLIEFYLWTSTNFNWLVMIDPFWSIVSDYFCVWLLIGVLIELVILDKNVLASAWAACGPIPLCRLCVTRVQCPQRDGPGLESGQRGWRAFRETLYNIKRETINHSLPELRLIKKPVTSRRDI